MYDNDDDYQSISSAKSDDEVEEIYYHTHRSCSRYGTCNRKQHEHTSVSSDHPLDNVDNLKAKKGDVRSVDDRLDHRQKYDGTKWRRICSHPDCLLYLNGGIYFKKWLCRKHYLLSKSQSNEIISTKKNSTKSSIQLVKNRTDFQHGEVRRNAKGKREKFNGQTWRTLCTYKNCKSYAITHHYCHRHNTEMNRKRPNIPQINKTTKSSCSPIENPKKGDVHCVRQRWNGTKWYSLCHHHSQTCQKRSQGMKYGYLCDVHYRQSLTKQKESSSNDRVLLSPRVRRKKSITYEIPTITVSVQQSTHDSMHDLAEQMTQTDLTYSPETNDLRQGCFLIDDNTQPQEYRCDSPLVMICIKNEDDDLASTNRHQIAIDTNSLAFNCKLEIPKLEL